MTRKPFQIKFLIYAQSCFKDSTSPDGFPTPDSAEQKPQGHSGNTAPGVLGFTTFPKTMAESSPSVFLIVMGPQIWVNFGMSKLDWTCVFYRSSVTSPLHRFYHHFKSSLTLCLTVALLCVRRISTRSNIWNSNGPKRQSVPSCPNQSTLSGC